MKKLQNLFLFTALLIALPACGQAQNHVKITPDNKPAATTETAIPDADIEKTLQIASKRPLYFFSDYGLSLGARLLAEEKYGSAVETFRRVLEVNPRNIDAEAGMGAAQLGMKNIKAASDHIRRALSRDNKHLGAQYLYGRYYLAIDRTDLALEQLNVLNMLCGIKHKCIEALALEGDINAYTSEKNRQ